MLKRFSMNYVLFSLCMDLACIVGALALGTYLRQTLPYGLVPFSAQYPEGMPPTQFYFIALALWVAIAFAVSLYDPRKAYKAVDEFQTLALAMGFFALAKSGVLYFSFRTTSRLLMLYTFAATWIFMLGWRVVARLLFRLRPSAPGRVTRILIVGAGDLGQRVADMVSEYAWTGLYLVGYLDDDLEKRPEGAPVLGRLEDVDIVVRKEQIDDVILALPPQAHEQMNRVVSLLHELPVDVRVIPDYFSLALYRATVDDFGGIPMINLRDPALNDYQRLVKRFFDLTAGGLITLLLLPLMGLIAAAIKLDSPGPVLFKQDRVGENGRIFKMYKFRSMVVGAETLQDAVNHVDGEGHVVHKCKGDPRVTPVGRFIRRWSLDELPQFFNVLRGELSLVGPRPELPWLVDSYEPWQRKRFAVPQGITGWWQVNGRSDKVMHLHTDEDLYYIQNYSLWLDLYILLKTPWVVVRGKGAY